MFWERLHKFKGELREEARRLRNRLKEELDEPETASKGEESKIVPN